MKNILLAFLFGIYLILVPESFVIADSSLCRLNVADPSYPGSNIIRGVSTCPRGRAQEGVINDIFGDGSDGDVTVNGNRLIDGEGREYRNITVERDATLRLPSGTFLRCSGRLLNRGTIEVQRGAFGGLKLVTANSMLSPASRAAHPGGVSIASAADGLISYSDTAYGGAGGTERTAGGSALVRLPTLGGGGGGAGITQAEEQGRVGGLGGGSAMILCGQNVDNQGTISATGESGRPFGGGGGAGGFLIIGARDSVANSGTISVVGGDGAESNLLLNSTAAVGAGGGGAGGHVQIIVVGRSFRNTGTVLTAGGAAGAISNDNPSLGLFRSGGGQGGSLFAAGGAGGSIVSNAFQPAAAGQNGELRHLALDPVELKIGY
jgi:hypothetical protein